MTAHRPALRPAALTALLTLIAGYVDAIGYLHLGAIYTANMSGNSVALGIHSARLDWAGVWKHGWPIACYACGLLLSRLILTWAHRREIQRAAAISFFVEAAFLAGFLAIRSGTLAVFCLAFAMGVQAAAIPHVGGASVYTCFVTGTLVRMFDTAAEAFWTFWDACMRPPPSFRFGLRVLLADPAAAESLWYASNWSAYVVGAISGTLVLIHLGVSGIWLAFCVIAAYVILGLRAPQTLQQIR